MSSFANFFLLISNFNACLWLYNIHGRCTVIPSFKGTIYDNSSLWHTLHVQDTSNIKTFLFQEATSAPFPACAPNFTSTAQTILTTREHAAAKSELLLISMELAFISITAYNLASDSGWHVWNPLKYKHLSAQESRRAYYFRSPIWMAL